MITHPLIIQRDVSSVESQEIKIVIFGVYNPNENNIVNFVIPVGLVLDYYMPKYGNFLLLGEFSSEMSENTMLIFFVMLIICLI